MTKFCGIICIIAGLLLFADLLIKNNWDNKPMRIVAGLLISGFLIAAGIVMVV